MNPECGGKVKRDLIMLNRCASHGVNAAADVLVFDGTGRFAGQIIINRHNIPFKQCLHDQKVTRARGGSQEVELEDLLRLHLLKQTGYGIR